MARRLAASSFVALALLVAASSESQRAAAAAPAPPPALFHSSSSITRGSRPFSQAQCRRVRPHLWRALTVTQRSCTSRRQTSLLMPLAASASRTKPASAR